MIILIMDIALFPFPYHGYNTSTITYNFVEVIIILTVIILTVVSRCNVQVISFQEYFSLLIMLTDISMILQT